MASIEVRDLGEVFSVSLLGGTDVCAGWVARSDPASFMNRGICAGICVMNIKDSNGNPIQSGCRYTLTYGERSKTVQTFYDSDGRFVCRDVAKSIANGVQLVGDQPKDAEWVQVDLEFNPVPANRVQRTRPSFDARFSFA